MHNGNPIQMVEQSSPTGPIRMLVTKQNQLIIPISSSGTGFPRQGVILSEVSTPSGVKLVQLLLNQERRTVDSPAPPPASHPAPSPAPPTARASSSATAVPEDIKPTIVKTEPESTSNICTICGDTFIEKLAFNAHIKVHLKEKLKRRLKLSESRAASVAPPVLPKPVLHSYKRKLESNEAALVASKIKLEPLVQKEYKDNYVTREFSKEMELTKVDINNDLSLILDQMAKDFDGPNIDISNVHLDTPPDSESDNSSEYLTSLLGSQASPRDILDETLSPAPLAETPNSLSLSNPLDDTGEISFENLLDVDTLQPAAKDARLLDNSDHDYLLTGSLSSGLECSPGKPALQVQTSLLSPISVTESPPRKIYVHKTTDPRLISILSAGNLHSPSSQFGQSLGVDGKLSDELELERGRFQQRPKQSAECSICQKTITTKNMARHMEKHTGKKKFQCDVCQAAFYQKTHLKNHILLHDSSEFYECGECGQKFLRKADHLKHLKAIHSIDIPLVCTSCGHQFTDFHKLEVHKQLHNGERQELCGLCGEKFYSKQAMITHMQKHTSPSVVPPTPKPFSCSVCHKTFSQKSHLNRHIKSHGGEPDLVCLVCNKQCKNKLELVRHRSSHLACAICKSLFDTRVQLQQHMLKSHPISQQPGLISLHMMEEEEEDLCRSPVDILSNHLDSSPAPSSVDSGLDLLEHGIGFGHFLADLGSEEVSGGMLDHSPVRAKNQLSLDDIADSSFFDINHHLDEDMLSTDIFASVK